MADKKTAPKELEDHPPGATRKEVLAALGKTAKPIKKRQGSA